MTSIISTSDYKFEFKNAALNQLEMQSRRRLYAKRPDIWARDVLGVTLWSKQVEVALSIVENKSTMVAAGHGVGKSYLTAVLACWWIDTHPIGEARVLTTAPTTAQVRGIVWREMQAMHKKSRERHAEYMNRKRNGESTDGLPDHSLVGYITSSATWRTNDGFELGSGRTPPRGREGDAFQGIHGGVFAIADEAVGVSKDMIDTLANNTTADHERRLLIANPTNPASEMGQIWNDAKRAQAWNRITISVLDSPHFTEEHKVLPESVLKYMTSHRFVEDKKLEYGEESANYKARVLGLWALDSGMILFPEEVIARGLETTVIPDDDDEVHVGFDVSRSEKGDFSYLYTAQEGWVYETQEWVMDSSGSYDWSPLPKPRRTNRRGIKIRYLDRWRGLPFEGRRTESGIKIEEGANDRVHAHVLAEGATQLRVDADGMGLIMMDAMHNVYGGRYHLVRFKGGDPSPDRNGWYNQRAYQYSELARRMRAGEVDIEEDADEHPLTIQLSGIEYEFAEGYANSMLILSKKKMKAKGIASPDAADAAIYSFADIDIDGLAGILGDAALPNIELYSAGFDSFYTNSSW